MHCHSNLFMLGLDARNVKCRRGGLCWRFLHLKNGSFYLSHDSIWVITTKPCSKLRINFNTGSRFGKPVVIGGSATWAAPCGMWGAGGGGAVAVQVAQWPSARSALQSPLSCVTKTKRRFGTGM